MANYDIEITVDLNDDVVVTTECGCDVDVFIDIDQPIEILAFDWPPVLDLINKRVEDLAELAEDASILSQAAAEAVRGLSDAVDETYELANDAAQAAVTNSGRLDALETIPVENFSESFNLTADKANTIQNCTSAIDVTVTILLNESGEKFLLLPVAFEQAGNGVVSIVGADGVTVPAANKTAGQGKMIVLYEKSLNVYGIAGGVE